MTGLMAGQPKMSHTNNMSFFLPSQKILKLLAGRSLNIVFLCDYEVWVQFVSHYYVDAKLGNLKHDIMSHTYETGLLVRNSVTAVEMLI